MTRKIKTIEQVAKILLKEQIPFHYSPRYLEVKGATYQTFRSASYHRESKELVLMDDNYKQVDVSQIFF